MSMLHALSGDARRAVAFGEGGARTLGALRAEIARLRDVVAASSPGPVLLVFERDRYAFTASLFAALAEGRRAVLPPSTRRQAIEDAKARAEAEVILHDLASAYPHRVTELLGEGDVDGPSVTLPGDGDAMTVFTSGSTGAMSATPKTLGQLDAEVAALAALLDVRDGDRIVATVGPGHLYGLLYSVWLPLVAGAAFLRETPFHAEPVADRVSAFDATHLVTVPLHLRSLRSASNGALESLRAVASSTAPLGEPVASAFAATHGKPIVEVLGSTETGGIASRPRPGLGPFTPLDGVRASVDDDGHLLIDAPYLHPEDPRPYRCSDLAEIDEAGRIHHRGRRDGVVKIGGRRVSLAEIEATLLAQPGVRDAAVLAVEGQGARDVALLGALVGEGLDADAIRSRLADRFEPSTLPRRLTILDALPREANGKLGRRPLLRALGLGDDGRPLRRDVDLALAPPDSDEGDGAGHARFRAQIPEDLAWYEGHFPGYPIMAGAVQLHVLVLPALRLAFPSFGEVRAMKKIKFTGRIEPGDEVFVDLVDKGDGRVRFRIEKGASTCTAGLLEGAMA